MATKHIQRGTPALFGVPIENKIVYPFAISKKISKTISEISTNGVRSANILPDLCGYLSLQNRDIIKGTVRCQVTSLIGNMYVELGIYESWPGSPSVRIYSSPTFYTTNLNSENPINFELNVSCTNPSKNNLVRLFIYAYNSVKTSENSFDLGYFEESTAS
jgi:hypothetical protein